MLADVEARVSSVAKSSRRAASSLSDVRSAAPSETRPLGKLEVREIKALAS